MGYLGVAGNVGMALGPVVGSFIRVHMGYDAMFIASGLFGLVAYGLSLLLKETLPNPKRIKPEDFNVFKGKRVDFISWPAAVLLLPAAFAFGVFLTVSPDFVGNLGYTYRGSFNTTIVISSIATRIFAGKASDRHGRIMPLIVGMVLLTVGMGVISIAESAMVATIGGVIYGVSVGINMPTIFAYTVDFARKGKVAQALGTMLIALEVGIGIGAVISGYFYGGEVERIPFTYQLCAVISILAAVVLFVFRKHPALKPPEYVFEVKP
jgi:MFS family permease